MVAAGDYCAKVIVHQGGFALGSGSGVNPRHEARTNMCAPQGWDSLKTVWTIR